MTPRTTVHSASKTEITQNCEEYGENFHSFYSLLQHKVPHKDLRKKVELAEVLQALRVEYIQYKSRQDDLQWWTHFLVDSEIENARVRFFI